MTNKDRENYQATLREIFGSRPVAYYPALARKVGGVKAAVMLCQCLYWNGEEGVQDRGGWFYKSVDEMEKETGLTKVEQQTAREILVSQGLLEAKLKGIPRVWYYRVIWESLEMIFIGKESHSMETPPNDEPENPPNIGKESHPILGKIPAQLNESKTTAKTTTKTTARNGSRKRETHPPEELPVKKAAGSERYSIAQVLAEVCHMDFEKNKGLLLREAKNFTSSDIARIRTDYGPEGAWFTCDFRGLKHEPPTPSFIRQTWGRLIPTSNAKTLAEAFLE